MMTVRSVLNLDSALYKVMVYVILYLSLQSENLPISEQDTTRPDDDLDEIIISGVDNGYKKVFLPALYVPLLDMFIFFHLSSLLCVCVLCWLYDLLCISI